MNTMTKKRKKVLCSITMAFLIFCVCCWESIAFGIGIFTTVNYHANGATSGVAPVDHNVYEADDSVTVMGCGNLQCESSVFIGWNTAADGTGTNYQQGDTFSISGDVHLYAQWGVVTDIHYSYMSGYTDGAFGPSNFITRAEVAQMFYNLHLNKETVPILEKGDQKVDFIDVKDSGAWFYNAVMLLSDYGIISGYEDGRFAPSGNISRAEFASMVAKAVNSTAAGSRESPFFDVPKTHWALPAIAFCKERNYVSGYEDSSFKPGNPITRAEVVSIVSNMLSRKNAHPDDQGIFPDVSREHWAINAILESGTTHGFYINSSEEEVWLPLYHVSYNGNGADHGEPPVDNSLYTSGMQVRPSPHGMLSKAGYDFSKWNTKADGSGSAYVPESSFLMPSMDVTLYAQWDESTSITPNPQKEIASVSPCSRINVEIGTVAEELSLPGWIEVSLKDGTLEVLEVKWDTSTYDSAILGTITLTGTLLLPIKGSILNSANLTAHIDVTVENTKNPAFEIVSVVPCDDIFVDFGTEVGALSLPRWIVVMLENGKTEALRAHWNTDTYDSTVPTTYPLMGALVLPADNSIVNSSGLTAIVNVTVRDQPSIPIQYTVTFDTGSGTPQDIQVVEGDTVARPPDPVRDGYTFTGWHFAGDPYDFDAPVVRDFVLDAKWAMRTCTVTFDTVGGTDIAPIVVEYGKSISTPADPAKSGFSFGGWRYVTSAGDVVYDFAEPVLENITLIAIWTTQEFYVTYHRNGAFGTAPLDLRSYPNGETVSVQFLHNMVYNTYSFLGWSTSSDAKVPEYAIGSSIDFAIDRDIDLYAVWSLAIASANGVQYDSLEEALSATTSGTVYLGKSDQISGTFTSTENVTLVVNESVSLKLNPDALLVVDKLLHTTGSSLINDGVIIGKVSADFGNTVSLNGFGSYKGSGVIFSSSQRYRGTDLETPILETPVSAGSVWTSSSFYKGVLTIEGNVPLSDRNIGGEINVDHWVSFSYLVPEETLSIETKYATFHNGWRVAEQHEGSNTVFGTHSQSDLYGGRFLPVTLSAQYFQTDGYSLYCPSQYTLSDGSRYMELFQVEYNVSINPDISIDSIEGDLNMIGTVYTIPAGHTVTATSGIRLGYNFFDFYGNISKTCLQGVDDTSVLRIQAGVTLYFFDGAESNFYSSTKLPLYMFDQSVPFLSDTEFWWDTSINGWVSR